mmetsp:Transcript_11477/g.47766  ORF Transcript_11477/g.47766 Transcript_11477/m.47766 type:complete len:509 (+) Transcript_11477:318-1844(+)
MDNSRLSQGWVMVFTAGLLNCLQAGTFFMTPTTLMPLIVKDFDLTIAQASIPIAIGKLCYVLFLVPGGVLVDHFGVRYCLSIGFLGLAILTSAYGAFVSTFAEIILVHIALSAFSSTSGVPVYAVVVASWFTDNLGLAMGMVLSGFSLAGTAIPAILAPIARVYGWRVAMGTMSSILWFVALPLSFFVLKEKPGKDAHEEFTPTRAAVMDEVELELEDRGLGLNSQEKYLFVLFSIAYFALQYQSGCFQENILYFLHTDQGLEISTASLFLSALNFGAFAAKLVGGYLGDIFDRFNMAVILSLFTTAGILMLYISSPVPSLSNNFIFLFCFSVLFGIGYGSTFNALYSIAPVAFGKAGLGRIQSSLFAVGLTGNAIGSVFTGILRTQTGDYRLAFTVALLLSVFTAAVLLMISCSKIARNIREEQYLEQLTGASTESLFGGVSEDFVSVSSYDSVFAARQSYWQKMRNRTFNTFVALRTGYGQNSGGSVHGMKRSETFLNMMRSGLIG